MEGQNHVLGLDEGAGENLLNCCDNKQMLRQGK
jgi:hypothetical protein